MTIIRGISINDDQQVPNSRSNLNVAGSTRKPSPSNNPVKVNVKLSKPELPTFASFVDTLNTPTLINVNEFEYSAPSPIIKTEPPFRAPSMEKDTVDINSLPTLWTIDDMSIEESVPEDVEDSSTFYNSSIEVKTEIKTEPESPTETVSVNQSLPPYTQTVVVNRPTSVPFAQPPVQLTTQESWMMDERINVAVERLSIPVDPQVWSNYEVQKWAKYMLREYNIEVAHIEGLEEVDGTRMCMMSEQAFLSQFKVPEYGRILYVELDLWKNYSSISSPTEQLTYTDLSASLPQQQQQQPTVESISMTTLLNLPLSVTSAMELDGSFSSQSSYSSVTTSLSSSLSSSYPQTVPVLSSPMSETDQFMPSQQDQLTQQDFMSSEPQQLSQLPQIPIPNITTLMGSSAPSIDIPRPTTISPAPCSSGWEKDSGFASGHDSEDEVNDDEVTEHVGHATSGRHTIHLWKFLRELLEEAHLHNYCIKWLDREKGVFKIENSSAVAKLWGQRKNRPAMNYDKLSRSIRQYYKKGIIKKTAHSRRLVYQFCPNYL